MMRYLITGGCGFLGSNLALEVLKKGDQLTIVDNFFRTGSRENLEWLRKNGEFEFHEIDVCQREPIEQLIESRKPEVVFHLAGQVAMTTSIADPRLDFQTNVVGGINILEAVRKRSPRSIVFYSSTNKVYGDLEELHYTEEDLRYIANDFSNGFDEALRLDFRSPYGCSKGSVDQYMLDYHRVFGVRTVVFRHSSIFGGRQFPTFDQGWIGWFIKQAIETKRSADREPFTINGNGKQVRDVLFVDDLMRCYFGACQHIDNCAGEAFNIGGGMENSLSLLELFHFLDEELGIHLRYISLPPRESDQKVFVADTSKAREKFNWSPTVDKVEGMRQMITWMSEIGS